MLSAKVSLKSLGSIHALAEAEEALRLCATTLVRKVQQVGRELLGAIVARAALEHFRFLCSEAVAAMPHVICTFVGHEEAQCRGHQFADVLERAGTGGA